MSKELCNYIVNNLNSFFGRQEITPGNRYLLNLDDFNFVQEVFETLKETNEDKLSVIHSDNNEFDIINFNNRNKMIVFAQTSDVTDDFLTYLRNINLSTDNDKILPVLLICNTEFESIISATIDLSSIGYPFNNTSIVEQLENEIKNKNNKIYKKMLSFALEQKNQTNYSKYSSIKEFQNIINVIDKKEFSEKDFNELNLIYDDELIKKTNNREIDKRLEENRNIYNEINHVFYNGNIEEDLKNKYKSKFIHELNNKCNTGVDWFENLSLNKIKDNVINNIDVKNIKLEKDDIKIYGLKNNSEEVVLEPNFLNDKNKKNLSLIIFEENDFDKIIISFKNNKKFNKNIEFKCFGCYQEGNKSFIIDTTDNNLFFGIGLQYSNGSTSKEIGNINVCVIKSKQHYFEKVLPDIFIKFNKKNTDKSVLIYNYDDNDNEIIFNHTESNTIEENLCSGLEIDLLYNKKSIIRIDDSLLSENNSVNFNIVYDNIKIPFLLNYENKENKITGIQCFRKKYISKKSFTYDNNAVYLDLVEKYIPDSKLRNLLEIEDFFINIDSLYLYADIEDDFTFPEEHKFTNVKFNDKYKEDQNYENIKNLIDSFNIVKGYYAKNNTLPSLTYYDDEGKEIVKNFLNNYFEIIKNIPENFEISDVYKEILSIGMIYSSDKSKILLSPLHPLNLYYQLELQNEIFNEDITEDYFYKFSHSYLIPFLKNSDGKIFFPIDNIVSPEWSFYALLDDKKNSSTQHFVPKLINVKINQFKEYFYYLFNDKNNLMKINLVNTGDCKEIFKGLVFYYIDHIYSNTTDKMLKFEINIYNDYMFDTFFSVLSERTLLKNTLNEFIEDYSIYYPGRTKSKVKERVHIHQLNNVIRENIKFYKNNLDAKFVYSHITFNEMSLKILNETQFMDNIKTGIALNGLLSNITYDNPGSEYIIAFGRKYVKESEFINFISTLNSLYAYQYSKSSYNGNNAIFVQVDTSRGELLNKIYESSNWVTFISPKVDLRFFNNNQQDNNIKIIHYSDQFTSSSGYDDITVTSKRNLYENILKDILINKGIDIQNDDSISKIIDIFNAINGEWLLKLLRNEKHTNYFSREKISIISAIKVSLLMLNYKDILWVPLSLEGLIRVSGGTGLSLRDSIFGKKFSDLMRADKSEHVASDDILMVGLKEINGEVHIYFHPVEVKIGYDNNEGIHKGVRQIKSTYDKLFEIVAPEVNTIESKILSNEFVNHLIVAMEKMAIYDIYNKGNVYSNFLDKVRAKLLNNQFTYDKSINEEYGNGTVLVFKRNQNENDFTIAADKNIQNYSYRILSFKEEDGYEYLVKDFDELQEILNNDFPSITFNNVYNKEKYVEPVDTDGEDNVITDEETGIDDYIDDKEVNNISDNIIEQSIENHLLESTNNEEILDVNESHETNKEFEEVNMSNTVNFNTEIINELDCKFLGNSSSKGINVYIGKNASTGEDIFWNLNNSDENSHCNTGIIGTMGTGKTQFISSIIAQIKLQVNRNISPTYPFGMLIFDYKGDYGEEGSDFVNLVQPTIYPLHKLPINPFSIKGLNTAKLHALPLIISENFANVLEQSYNLGTVQVQRIKTCVQAAYKEKNIDFYDKSTWNNTPPTFDDVYRIYMNDQAKENKIDSLYSAMDSLYKYEVFESDPNKTKNIYEFIEGVVVIQLQQYGRELVNTTLAIMLYNFYYYMLNLGNSPHEDKYRQLRKVIFVDEADNFMEQEFPVLKNIIKEGRSFGVAIMLATQFLRHFSRGKSENYADYISSWFIHKVNEMNNTNIEKVLAIPKKEAESENLVSKINQLENFHSYAKVGNRKYFKLQDFPFKDLYGKFIELQARSVDNEH